MVTITDGITFIITKRSGRDRHFDAHTAAVPNGSYFLKVTVTRCCAIKMKRFTGVTVTAVDLSGSGYLRFPHQIGAKFKRVIFIFSNHGGRGKRGGFSENIQKNRILYAQSLCLRACVSKYPKFRVQCIQQKIR